MFIQNQQCRKENLEEYILLLRALPTIHNTNYPRDSNLWHFARRIRIEHRYNTECKKHTNNEHNAIFCTNSLDFNKGVLIMILVIFGNFENQK